MPNSPPELWNVLAAAKLQNEAFGSWSNFIRIFNGYEGPFGLVWGTKPKRDLAAQALAGVMLRRRRVKVLPDLPVKLYRDMPVEIGAKTRKLCDEALAELTGGKTGNIVSAIESSIGNRQDKIKFEKLSEAKKALATAKIPHALLTVENFEEANEPVIVFTDHRSVTEIFGKREGWKIIDGGVPANKRTAIVEDFQEGKLKGLALTIGAGGIGLTLTRAHHALFVDLRWTPEDNAQAEDRLCRIGQDRGVVITHMVADHDLDRHINSVLKKKQILIQATLEREDA
jgi:TATA-binding protein-associated factor